MQTVPLSKVPRTREKEFFISRKAFGLALKVRHESFVGVGTNQTFSNIKDQTDPRNSNDNSRINKTQTRNLGNKLISFHKALRAKNAPLSRLAVHVVVLVSAVAVLGFGKLAPMNSDKIVNQSSGVGAADDQTSLITTGAILAESTKTLVGSDLKQKAQDVNAQVPLATAGDDFLAQRQPVATAGSPTRDITNYGVLNGDTIWSIAAKFNITTDTLKWANNLSDEDVLKPSTQLTILPTNGVLVTAAGGEDVAGLATKYKTSASLIDSYNNLEGKAPAVGQKLILPDGVKPEVPKPVVQVASTSTRSTTTATTQKLTPFYGGANGYSYGYCTWYVAAKRGVPSNWGNASSWYYNAQRSGFGVGGAPQAGAVAWEKGIWGAGHVAYVEGASGGMVTVSEMNYNGGWNRVSRRTVPASQFLYIY